MCLRFKFVYPVFVFTLGNDNTLVDHLIKNFFCSCHLQTDKFRYFRTLCRDILRKILNNCIYVCSGFYRCLFIVGFSDKHRYGYPFGFKRLRNSRITLALLFTHIENVWNTTAGTLAYINHIEHFHQSGISRVGYSSDFCCFHLIPQIYNFRQTASCYLPVKFISALPLFCAVSISQ